MGDTSPVAKRLKQARLRAGLSQRQLGIEAGIDAFSASPRINQYEKGRHTPDFSTARRLASVLDVPTPYLFAEDDTVADIILVLGSLSLRDRRKMLAELKSRSKTRPG